MAACLMPFISACALMGGDYSVSKATDEESAFLETKTDNNLYGHWLSNGDLRITLGFPLFYAAKISADTLKADVNGDLITLHLEEVAARAVKDDELVPLCDDTWKLTYILHGLKKQDYRILVDPIIYGNKDERPIVPLELK